MVDVPQNTHFGVQMISLGTSKEEPHLKLTINPYLESATWDCSGMVGIKPCS